MYLRAALAAGELGRVLGAAQLVLARVLDVVGAEVRLRRPSVSRIAYCDFVHVGRWIVLFTKRPVEDRNKVTMFPCIWHNKAVMILMFENYKDYALNLQIFLSFFLLILILP